jgi:hypothetical protein
MQKSLIVEIALNLTAFLIPASHIFIDIEGLRFLSTFVKFLWFVAFRSAFRSAF